MKTDTWWNTEWWRDEKYYKDGQFTKRQGETAFEELKKVFDSAWLLRQKMKNSDSSFQHPLINLLLKDGLYTFQFFCSLGIYLYRAKKQGLLTNHLMGMLRNPDGFKSAAFELQLLSCLLSQGFKVEKDYQFGERKNNCDFRITKGNEIVFLEAKRPRELHFRNEQICKKGYDQVEKIISENNNQSGNYKGDTLLLRPELAKIFRHIRDAVKNQLPSNGVGGVLIESSWPFYCWEIFEIRAHKIFRNKEIYKHLSFICAVRNYFNPNADRLRFDQEIKILINHDAEVDVSSYNVLSVLNERKHISSIPQ